MKNDDEKFDTKKFVQAVQNHAQKKHGCDYITPLLALDFLATTPDTISAFNKEDKNIDGLKQILKTLIQEESENRTDIIEGRISGADGADDRIENIVKKSLAQDDLEGAEKRQGENNRRNIENELSMLQGEFMMANKELTYGEIFKRIAENVLPDEILARLPNSLRPNDMQVDDTEAREYEQEIRRNKAERKKLDGLKKKYGSGSIDVGGWTRE